MPPKRSKGERKPEVAKKSSEKRESKKVAPGSADFNRNLWIAAAAATLLVALLIGSAHMLKRARRARRLAELQATARGETLAPAEPWLVVEPHAILYAALLLALLGVCASLAAVYSERFRQRLHSRRQARAAAAELAEVHASKARLKLDTRESRAASLKAYEARDAQAQQELIETEAALRLLREREAVRQQALKAEALAAARIDGAARLHAEQQDTALRAAAAAAAAAREDEQARWLSETAAEGTAADGVFRPAGEDEGGSAGWAAEEEEEAAAAAAAEANQTRMPLDLTPAARGTAVELCSLALGELATARPSTVAVVLSCARCSTHVEMELSGLQAGESEKKAWCANCAAMLGAALRPALLGAHSNLLAHVDTVACSVADVPRVGLLVQCGNCDAEHAVEELERGRRRRDHCRSCHQSLPVYMSNVALRHLAGSTGGAVRRAAEDEEDEMESLLKKLRKRSSEQLRQLGVCVGKPLPNKGACKHFKHSYRWLRFPCCGRCYPCATCHALSECPAAALGAWATRMVCGKCSREMAYSDRPCEHCGNTFTRPGGAHWQGGAGCRDQTRLSLKDGAKYRGASASGVMKTKSAKAQRVGKAGAIAAAAKKRVHVD